MKNISIAIRKRMQPVVWNPYENNDGIDRQEFIRRVKIAGYKTILFEDAWVTAYHSRIRLRGVETLQKHLEEAVKNELYVYATLLRNEINRLNLSVYESDELYY
jgi:hypothetical protein